MEFHNKIYSHMTYFGLVSSGSHSFTIKSQKPSYLGPRLRLKACPAASRRWGSKQSQLERFGGAVKDLDSGIRNVATTAHSGRPLASARPVGLSSPGPGTPIARAAAAAAT